METGDNSSITALRQKAEELLRKNSPKKSSPLSENDILKLIHELEVHHNELEMQNEKLKQSEEQFRNLFNNSLDAVAIHQIVQDEKGNPTDFIFLKANAAFEIQTGLHIPDIRGKRVTEVIPGITESPLIGIYGKVALTGEPITFEQFFEPFQKHYHINAYQVGPGRFVTNFQDITERKKIEEALRESEQKFRDTMTNLDEGYYSVTPEGRLLEHNQAFNRILNYDPLVDLRGLNLPDIWQQPGERNAYLEAVKANGSVSKYQIDIKTRTGENLTVLTSAHLVKDKKDHILRIEGILLDITEEEIGIINKTMTD